MPISWGDIEHVYKPSPFSVLDLLIIFEFRPKGSDTVSTMFVLHYWRLSNGHYTDGPCGQVASGVDR
jgi:hypothetical protein